jgi:hypothetical protein
LLRPGRAFAGLERERFTWLLPALLVALATILPSQTLLRPLYLERQHALLDGYVARGVLTAEQAHEMAARLPAADAATSAGALLPPLFTGIAVHLLLRTLLPALLLLGGAAFLFEARSRLTTMLGIVGFASLPAALRELLQIPWALARGDLTVSFSPALLIAEDSLGRYALGLLDLFDLWILALLMTALVQLTSLTAARAALLVLPLWLVYALMRLGLRASPFGGAL